MKKVNTFFACRLIAIILILTTFSHCEDKEKTYKLIVMTFENQSATKENNFIGVGVTDEIISKLSGIKNFQVLSQDALLLRLGYAQTFGSAGENYEKKLLEQIESLGEKPDYVVLGSFAQKGEVLSLYASVINRKTKEQIAEHKEDGTVAQWGELRGILTLKIMEKMKIPLTKEDSEKLKQADNPDFAAFRENYTKKIDYYKSLEEEIKKLEIEAGEMSKKAKACEIAAKDEDNRDTFSENEKLLIYQAKLCGMTLQGFGFNKISVSDVESWYAIYGEEIISILNRIPENYFVEIQGHSDASVVKSKTESTITSNEKMSEERSKIVYNKLIENNAPEGKLKFAGYSFSQAPDWLGKEEISNRRVVFVLKNKGETKKGKSRNVNPPKKK